MTYPQKPTKLKYISTDVVLNGKTITSKDSLSADELNGISQFCKLKDANLNLATMQIEYISEKSSDQYFEEIYDYLERLSIEIDSTCESIKQNDNSRVELLAESIRLYNKLNNLRDLKAAYEL